MTTRLLILLYKSILAILLLYFTMVIIFIVPELLILKIKQMEKELLINSSVIIFSLSFFLMYRMVTKKVYGLQNSISKVAKYYQRDGMIIVTVLFVLFSLVLPFLYFLRGTHIGIISACLITGIAGYTGYNPELKNRKLQDILHVVLTLAAMTGYCVVIFILNIWYLIPIIFWLTYTMYHYFKKTHQHTRKIEEMGYYIAIGCFVIEFIILKI
jgi:hypothetical protein